MRGGREGGATEAAQESSQPKLDNYPMILFDDILHSAGEGAAGGDLGRVEES